MNLKQISTIINEQIVPNTMGKEATIAEDLSNIVDLGKSIADLTADDVKNIAKNFVVGVAKTYWDTRRKKSGDLGIFYDSQTYGGIIQRVKAKLLDTEDSPIWTLENGTDYFDGVYRGIETDNKIFSQDGVWKIVNSIPVEKFKQYFTSAEGVGQLVALIEATIENTIDRNIHALAKRVICQLAVGGNKIHLLTQYKTESGKTLTAQQALIDKDFQLWLATTILRLRDLITEWNTKYNDGTIETFTPEEDTRVILLSEIDKKMQVFMTSDVYHNELVKIGEYNTVNFWQNQGTDLLPTLGVTSEIKVKNGEETTTVSNCIGVLFDKWSCGITARLDKVTAQYIANGDYTNYFHHIINRRFVDSRNSAITLLLD